ncbi:MAG TPA: TonB-dependent receptor, partial [Blastocatellia bacterium]|nr:TonB-dependent receptor [Blastocatellia bacterium]
MRYKFKGLLMTVTVLALVAQTTFPVFAQQSPTGSIRGVVSDPQGAVIPRAVVTVTNKATGASRKVDTGDDGIYLVSTLLPGEYEVKVEAQGFATLVISTTVEVGKTSPGDAQLRVGAANEIVDVVSEAPVIDKTNYKIDGVISRQKIDSLPLNGRNFLQLALLEPGVSVSVSTPGNANNLFNVSFGGSSAANTRITVDGGSVLDFVTGGAAQNFSTETIQEFQISSFNFDLSTGVTASGAVNIVSRTGTNDYHGSALFFARDDAWAAVPTLGRGAPDFRRYQYGGSIGGPIKKDRAFFFGNVEWLDQDSVFSTVHTGHPAFTQLDNITGSNYDGIVANIRGDFKINDKNNLFTRYSYDDNDTFGPEAFNTLPSNWRVNTNRDHNIQAGLTTVFNQNLVNDLRFNYQRIKNDSLIPSADDCPP